MQSSKAKLERFSMAATPAALTVLLLLLAVIPFHIPGLRQMMPAFVLISIYYWNTFLPGALPYFFLFILGLLQDVFSGLPIGVSSAVNILFALLLMREYRNFGKSRFGAVWFGFIFLSLVAFTFEWALMGFYSGHILPVSRSFLQWGVTCLAYPLMHLLLTRIYRVLIS